MKIKAILFDCDGVLADSETITNRVLCGLLNTLGWPLTLPECMAIFVGKTIKDEAALIHQKTGFYIDDAWLKAFRAQRDERLLLEVQAVPNIVETVAALHQSFAGRIACASGADRPKIRLMLNKLGLLAYFDQHIHSGQEQARNKPAPDVYLAAAKGLNVHAENCIVVEDTVTGVAAGVAAGAMVLGYSPPEAGHHGQAALKLAGAAQVFADMADLPALVRQAQNAGPPENPA